MSNHNDQSEIVIYAVLAIATALLFKIKYETGLSFQTIIQTIFLWVLFGGVIWLNKQTLTILDIGSHWNILAALFLLTLIPVANEVGTTMESTKRGPIALLDIMNEREARSEPEWYAETFWQMTVIIATASSKYVISWVSEKIKNR